MCVYVCVCVHMQPIRIRCTCLFMFSTLYVPIFSDRPKNVQRYEGLYSYQVALI